MNNIDKQYQNLLQDIIDNGVTKQDRTGTGTISVFGRQIRHKMSDGFPLLTTKKMPFKTIVTELLWFLRGDTNIKYLVDNNCHIWDGDAWANYSKNVWKYTNLELLTKEQFINKIKTDDKFAKQWGDLGKIYGFQWRNWNGRKTDGFVEYESNGYNENIKGIDQITNLINELKTNPDSRRLMVNAWNVGELDQMVLPPCHYGFQVYTRELSLVEMIMLAKYENEEEIIKTRKENVTQISEKLLKDNIPTRAISLMWNQRSVDTFLGLPFNITSYGLLLEIIAKAVNMVPEELIGNLGDTHLYSNHIEQAKEQIGRKLTFDERYALFTGHDTTWEEEGGNSYGKINGLDMMDDKGIPTKTREPYPLPTLKILDNKVDDIAHYEINDFVLEGYQSHPTIKAPLSN
jgi:thymidylate synthase